MICHHCGQDMPEAHEWHGLRVDSAGSVYWRGIRHLAFTKTEARILLILARRGEAPHLSLEMLSESIESITVHICRVRKKLKEARIPIGIENIYGFGYRLAELVN